MSESEMTPLMLEATDIMVSEDPNMWRLVGNESNDGDVGVFRFSGAADGF